MASQKCIQVLLKAAAALASAAGGYTVARGDTLSAIASRNGTTWKELARLNGLQDPNRLRIGQRIMLPPRPALPSTPATRFNQISARLHTKLNNPNLEAGILANFDRETGGKFDYATKEVGGGGYGIPQYTGASLAAYRNWLAAGKRQDSANSQIDYFVDKYMPSRAGYRQYTAPGAKYTREQYADWLHRKVFTPAHTIPTNKAYSQTKINQATQRHNTFMQNRMKPVNGVWQFVKASEDPAPGYERPYTARQMLAAGYDRALVRKLMLDKVHGWRARTGIELVHKEPDLKEAIRVWANWNRMSAKDKARSDRKSIALFGVDNKTHFERLRPTYEESAT